MASIMRCPKQVFGQEANATTKNKNKDPGGQDIAVVGQGGCARDLVKVLRGTAISDEAVQRETKRSLEYHAFQDEGHVVTQKPADQRTSCCQCGCPRPSFPHGTASTFKRCNTDHRPKPCSPPSRHFCSRASDRSWPQC